jgi:hypothetical protein
LQVGADFPADELYLFNARRRTSTNILLTTGIF